MYPQKDRCDGQRPSCSPCAVLNLVCSYEQTTKKRGLPEGYVRGLEKLWALSIGKISGLEDAVSQITDQHHQELLELWNHDVTGEELHTIWKESKILNELEYLLSGLERDTPTGSKRKRDKDDEGDTPDSQPSSLHRQVQYHVSQHPNGGQKIQELRGSMLSPDSPSRISLPAAASKLLDHYFAYTHCWFPILARPQVLRTFYEHSRTDQTPNPDLAVLWAVFAYTTGQNRDQDAEDSASEKSSRIATAKEFRRIARSLIPPETEAFAIGHVQALLLLSLLDIGLGDWHSSCILVGIAIRSALGLQIGSNVAEKRGIGVLQGCFILDTLIASHLEQPAHLRRSDMQNFGYLEEDGHEEWEPWNPPRGGAVSHQDPGFIISCFNRLFDVFLLFNDIVNFKSLDKEFRRTYFEKCAMELNTLQGRFPASISSPSQLPPHQVYLRLFFCSTLILVLRQLEGGAPTAALATTACDILELLTKYAQDLVLGLPRLPSMLENPVRSACCAAITSKPIFGESPGLPSYTSFVRRMADHVSQISLTWPVFSPLPGLWQTALRAEEQSSSSSLSSRDISRIHRGGQETFPFLQPGTFEKSFPPVQWPPDTTNHRRHLSHMNSESTIPTVRSDQIPAWSLPGVHTLPFSSAELDRTLDGGSLLAPNPVMRDPSKDRTDQSVHDPSDMSMSGADQFSPAGLAIPTVEASPSFHGDDVDAIFHNLVHLDTTEWTNSRSQGLKDFGFADDMTFQAFCNDPERLVAPGAPFGQPQNGGAEFWPSGSLQTFPPEKVQNQDERVGWWG
jgi:Fungal specific transcription factor domain